MFPIQSIRVSAFLLLFCASAVRAQPVPEPLTIRSGVAVGPVVRGARRPFVADPVQFSLVRGTWRPPVAGDIVRLPDGTERKYVPVEANAEGVLQSEAFSGGYFYAEVRSPEPRIALLHAQGHSLVYVNGEPRTGDPYRYGYVRTPVRLQRGVNRFLFSVGRGQLRAELLPAVAPASLNPDDVTLPDLIPGDTCPLRAAIPVINASEDPLTGLRLRSTIQGKTVDTALPTIPPMSFRKVAFQVPAPANLPPGEVTVDLRLSGPGIPTDERSLRMRVRKPGDTYKRTFLSEIDGSVQYYAVHPSTQPDPGDALILSLHGASVEAIGQADAYGPKDWATLIAPTNRRPFGFDWEDWGRLDALEVLRLATSGYAHDPARVVLTGHSMGGHGTWSLGSLFPDRFAALGPSAGWISFGTYGAATRGVRQDGEKIPPAVALLERASNVHDTLLRLPNLLRQHIYVLHGDADDNVPVDQARRMRSELEKVRHPSLLWHEQKGAGHWWDVSDAPGADCVDWQPMFDTFRQSRLTAPPGDGSFDFLTVNPAVSATCRWLRIEQQERPLLPSVVRAAAVVNGRQTLTTENVAMLTIFPTRLPDRAGVKALVVDGTVFSLSPRQRNPIVLRRNGGWKMQGRGPNAAQKNPNRGGPFKEAFNQRFILLYPTNGTPEETAWGFARARYDAETFYYRGNGSPEVMADTAYDPGSMRDRSVILYGNATINTRWTTLLKDCPVRAERGSVRVGSTVRSGDDLAFAFLYPKPGSDRALVGAVGGTGMIGLRLTDRLPYFISGAAFPDGVLFDPQVLAQGADAVLAAFYFDNDWKIRPDEIGWR
ncbi:MAG: prolyl oligopeptidase family serine peptidase [Capsulimonadales bacterium]|nr:prolyl oligopeptidase family serine peptidase [Capsulimonadales bacterium]